VQPVIRTLTQIVPFPGLPASQGVEPGWYWFFHLAWGTPNTEKLPGQPHTFCSTKTLVSNGIRNQADVLAVHLIRQRHLGTSVTRRAAQIQWQVGHRDQAIMQPAFN
jgi:hypothetical protein